MNVSNSLKFTQQTEILLNGLGAEHLIKECKRRNISTDALFKLTKEDFMQLGADESCAENLVSTLCDPKKKNVSDMELKSSEIIPDNLLDILKVNEKQLDVIRIFMKYCKCRLRNEREENTDFFIEPNKALCASQILCVAVDSVLKEINEAESKLKELKVKIIEPKTNYFYMWHCISFGMIPLASMILYLILRKH